MVSQEYWSPPDSSHLGRLLFLAWGVSYVGVRCAGVIRIQMEFGKRLRWCLIFDAPVLLLGQEAMALTTKRSRAK